MSLSTRNTTRRADRPPTRWSRALLMAGVAVLLTAGLAPRGARGAGAPAITSLISEYQDLDATARLARGPIESLPSNEASMLFGVSARAERFLRLVAVEEGRALYGLCKCRREMGKGYDPNLLELHSAFAAAVIDSGAAGAVDRVLSRAGAAWKWRALGLAYTGCLKAAAGVSWEKVRPCEGGVPATAVAAWRDAYGGGGEARQTVQAALIAFAPVGVDGKLQLDPLFAEAGGGTFGKLYAACLNGAWTEAARLIGDIDYAELGQIDDPRGQGVSYINPVYPLALARVEGQVARAAGRKVLPGLSADEREVASGYFARSCYYSGGVAEAEWLLAQSPSWRASLWAGARLARPEVWTALQVPPDPADRIEFAALQARLGGDWAPAGSPRASAKTFLDLQRNLLPQLQERSALAGLRGVVLEVLELALATGRLDDGVALGRLAGADIVPLSCRGRIDPSYLVVINRLQWEASRNNWAAVLHVDQCLTVSAGHRAIQMLDRASRWTAALCAIRDVDGGEQ